MIRSITVTNYLGDSIKLELFRPENSGFIVEKITGLGPGKANINVTEISTNDGSKFNSARLPSRNIVISLRYMFNSSIEDSRQRSYRYFPIKKPIKLVIETDNRLAEIEGYVESNEPNIFSKEEGSDISIICPNPFFYAVGKDNVTSFSYVIPMFEFPFSNESFEEKFLEMGSIVTRPDRVISYDGDSEIGITMSISAVGEASNISIYNVSTQETMRINTNIIEKLTGSGIVKGDELRICTVKGHKTAVLIRNGLTTNILNSIDRHADWFQLSKGDNIFAYTAESGANNLHFVISNRVVYEGV